MQVLRPQHVVELMVNAVLLREQKTKGVYDYSEIDSGVALVQVEGHIATLVVKGKYWPWQECASGKTPDVSKLMDYQCICKLVFMGVGKGGWQPVSVELGSHANCAPWHCELRMDRDGGEWVKLTRKPKR